MNNLLRHLKNYTGSHPGQSRRVFLTLEYMFRLRLTTLNMTTGKYFRSLLLSILIFIAVSAQLAFSQSDIPVLDSTDIPDAAITRSERYDGKSLWGYINGGADIYLEYGFDKVFVQELIWKKYQFKINVYRMQDEEAAFGIFSVSRHRCAPLDSISEFNCVTPYHIQIAHGRLYISIVNDNGSSGEQEFAIRLAKKILKKSKEKIFSLPTLFDKAVFLPFITAVKFFKGNLGIENGLQEWEDLFEGIKDFSVYILPIETKEGDIYTAQIGFKIEKEKNNFIEKLNLVPQKEKSYQEKSFEGIFRAVKELSRTKIIYLESNLNSENLKPYLQSMKLKK